MEINKLVEKTAFKMLVKLTTQMEVADTTMDPEENNREMGSSHLTR
jgi:hypothetical protein